VTRRYSPSFEIRRPGDMIGFEEAEWMRLGPIEVEADAERR
jgi:hypothetical protein